MSRSMSGQMAEPLTDFGCSDYGRVGGGLRELTEQEEKALALQLNVQSKFSYESTTYEEAPKPVFKVTTSGDENRNPYSVRGKFSHPNENPSTQNNLSS